MYTLCCPRSIFPGRSCSPIARCFRDYTGIAIGLWLATCVVLFLVPVGSRRTIGLRRELMWNELMDCVIWPASGSSIGGSVCKRIRNSYCPGALACSIFPGGLVLRLLPDCCGIGWIVIIVLCVCRSGRVLVGFVVLLCRCCFVIGLSVDLM